MDNGLFGGDDVLAECAAPAACAEHLLAGADVVQPVLAVPALAAAVVRLDNDAVADLEVLYVGADLNHVAGRLMAGHKGRDAERVQTVVCVYLGAADAAAADLNFYPVALVFSELRFRHVVSEACRSDIVNISCSHKSAFLFCEFISPSGSGGASVLPERR